MRLSGYSLALLILVLTSCGGGSSIPATSGGNAPAKQAAEGFSLSVVASPTAIGLDDLSLAMRSQGKQTVLEIIAARPLTAGSLLLELGYESGSYSPLDISASEALGPGSQALTIQQLERPGLLSYGRVPLGNARTNIAAGTVLATALFDNTAVLPTRGSSGVPVHNDALSPLFWDADTHMLTWYYVNPGDFDQNGLVGLADLVPLGQHFGEAGPFEFEDARSVIDGNRDGEIGLADLSVIGRYWGNSVEGYSAFRSDDINMVPVGYAEPSQLAPMGSVAFGDSTSNPMLERRSWSLEVASPTNDEFYWVRPYVDNGDGTLSEGTRSNINGGGLGENPEVGPGEPDYNFLPVAKLSLRILGQSVPLPVELDASASSDEDGEIIFFEWDFEGDGLFDAYGFEPVIKHNYSQSGTYAPLVRVTDNSGGSDTFQSNPFDATVASISNVSPSADITATAVSGITPLTLGFIGSGSYDVDGILTKFEWDFDGDGTIDLDSGSDSTVLHTYQDAGSFTALLRVTDNRGGQAQDTIEITVSDPPANVNPTADVIASPSGGSAPLTVSFDAGGSVDPDGTINSFFWSWDEGGLPESSGKDPSVSHTFNNPGSYNVTLTAIDNKGGQDIETVTITVVPPGQNVPPSADLFVLPGTGTAPLNCLLDAGGSYDPDGYIADYTWDLNDGNGSFSTGDDPTNVVTFLNPGDYSVDLTVTDNDGGTDNTSFVVHVDAPAGNSPPVADIFGVPTTGEAPLTVGFSAAGSSDSDGVITNYFWDWDDGSPLQDSGADPTVSHTFVNPGTYVVNLSVQDDDTATDADTLTITVQTGGGSNQAPTADFTPDTTSYTGVPLTVTFDPSASMDPDGTIARYDWDWEGDGLFDAASFTSASVQHTYTAFLEYNPVLRVTDDDGAFDDHTVAILPDIPPIADITSSPNPAGTGVTVTVDASGSDDPGGTITKFEFDLDGNGSYETDNGTNPVATTSFASTGDYILKVRITDNDSNQDTAQVTQEIRIAELITVTTSGSPSTRIKTDLIGGNPAIIYYDSGSDDLMYVRATNTSGTSWGNPVTVAFTGDVGRNAHLVEANGRPAVCYNNNNGGLYFLRADDSTGANWTETNAVEITTAGIGDCEMESISSNPAIAFIDNTANATKYVRASNADGSSWGTIQTVNSGGTNGGGVPSLAVVNGMPAVAFFYWSGSAGVKYRRANDVDGASWGTTVTIASDGSVNDSFDSPSLFVIDGNPAVSYESRAGSDLVYKRATDANGTSWGSQVNIDTSGDNTTSSLLWSSSLPFAAYFDNNAGQIRMAWGSDSTGSAWDSDELVDSGGDDMDTIDVGGKPFIVYFNGGVKVARVF